MANVIAYAILGLFIAVGIKEAGFYIGKGISHIKITVVHGDKDNG